METQTTATTNETNESSQPDLSKDEEEPIKIVHPSFKDYQKFTRDVKRCQGLGIILGLSIVFLQMLNSLDHSEQGIVMGPWVNIMGCLAAWSFFLAGTWLLTKVR